MVQYYTHNYQALLDGKLGDNLTRKYKCIVLSNHYSQCLSVAVDEAIQLCNESHVPEAEDMLKDLQIFLSTRDFKLFSKKDNPEVCAIKFDVPAWIHTDETKLINLQGNFQYQVLFTIETHKEINESAKLHGNPDLALQILFRDSTWRFWPEWQKLISEQDELSVASQTVN